MSVATFRHTTLITVLLSLLFRPVLAVDETLPDIGSPADTVLSKEQEQIIGRSIYKGLRDAGQIVTDPEIQEYIQNLGQRIAANAQNGDFRFQFFVINEPTINAFALPGGYIGIHSGLLLATSTESELAGVLAHEISHVTQRHISRAIYANQRTSILSMAAMLGAILLGAASGDSNVISGGIAGAQSIAIQGQINFTRENEYEADRVGVGLLAASGFDPYGMPNFFSTLARKTGTLGYQAPEFLRTHPVTVNRIAETRSRASSLPVNEVQNSSSYSLTRARIRFLSNSMLEETLTYFRAILNNPQNINHLGAEYGVALVLAEMGRFEEAKEKFAQLMAANEGIIHFHTGYATALAATGDSKGALAALEKAIELFPRNVPLTIRYAEVLTQNNRHKAAHQSLLDLYNQTPPTPEQVRQIALAASAAGDTADAHYYMAEYHLLSGDLLMASDQLVLALGIPGLDSVQKARFRSRLDEIQGYMPKRRSKSSKRRRVPLQ
ncbi:MAG TPA: M48 family metalloprotease [Gammaproteobacteria bacterium]|nr:peptidase M48 Ste24p [Chromatiales bacterium]MCP4924709.1 M48 family metallopeptidase [Gammaproteobacteria bacterium]MDP7296297.1 M48 family metalloprotease [Gammaproteobacteria bacterium]MDP7659960.1 M48 family metalloprotease [Gammaproteobacteria bacterium]HJP38496.1 M48 family metalloprotease [Gammaproteobacteria bacterium]